MSRFGSRFCWKGINCEGRTCQSKERGWSSPVLGVTGPNSGLDLSFSETKIIFQLS